MKNKLLIIAFALFHISINCTELLYPICAADNENIIVMYQKSLEELQLLAWNPATKTAIKLLSSFNMPSEIQMLPDKDGFSFIENGRIKVKKFAKRIPKSINIYEPIGSISSVNWIDSQELIFSAKEQGKYRLYHCNISAGEATLTRLAKEISGDIHFPKIIDNQIFFTENRVDGSSIFSIPATINSVSDKIFSTKLQVCAIKAESSELIYILLFKENEDENLFDFKYIQLQKNKKSWSSKKLFKFQLLAANLTGKSQCRAYESISPFLPSHCEKNGIFYVNHDAIDQNSQLHRFDLGSGKTEEIKNNLQILPPLFFNGKMFGGIIEKTETIYNNFSIDEATGAYKLSLLELD